MNLYQLTIHIHSPGFSQETNVFSWRFNGWLLHVEVCGSLVGLWKVMGWIKLQTLGNSGFCLEHGTHGAGPFQYRPTDLPCWSCESAIHLLTSRSQCRCPSKKKSDFDQQPWSMFRVGAWWGTHNTYNQETSAWKHCTTKKSGFCERSKSFCTLFLLAIPFFCWALHWCFSVGSPLPLHPNMRVGA